MKLKSVFVAALAAAFVFVGCDKNELTDPNKGDGTEQTDPNNPSDPSNPDGTDPEDPNNPGGENPGGENPGENPGGENPGENPGGENPENPTLPGTEISLFDFAQLPNSDQTLYRISGHVWTVDVDDDQTLVILANCLYDEDNFDPTKHAVVGILNPTWLNNLNPALRPGHVLTVAGSKGTFGEDPDGDAIILNSQYVSHVDYSEPYLVFDMYVNPYLGSEAGEYTFNVYSNTDWTVTAPEGTTVTPASGNGCAELTFTYPANAKLEDMFYPLAFSYSGKTVELKFQQQALRYSLELSQYHVEVAADSTVASVDVLSNGAWTVIAPEGVTATPASGNGSATVNFTFPANTIQEPVQYVAQVVGSGFVLEFIIDQAAAEKVAVLEDGKYWIVANNKVAKPLSGNYGYINVEDAWVSASSLASVEENAFTFKAVDGGYTIQDESGKYYYQTGTYNSFNVNASTQSDGSHIWTIEKVDGTYKITNNVVSKYVQFSTSYGNFGSYSTESGDLPTLVKVENAVPAVNVEEALTFEAEGGTQVIKLPAGVTATATSDNPAFTVSVQASAVTVTAGATTDAQSGNLTLVFSYNGFSLTKKVELLQEAAASASSLTIVLSAEKKPTSDFPEGSTGSTTKKSYTINGYDWTFSPSSGNKFSWYTDKYVLWGKKDGYILMPGVEGKKLISVTILTGKSASTKVNVGVYNEAGTAAVSGGAAKVLSATNAEFSWSLAGTTEGARYQLRVTSAHNAQFQKLVLIYE